MLHVVCRNRHASSRAVLFLSAYDKILVCEGDCCTVPLPWHHGGTGAMLMADGKRLLWYTQDPRSGIAARTGESAPVGGVKLR